MKIIKHLVKQTFSKSAAQHFIALTLGFGLIVTVSKPRPANAAGVVGNGTASSCNETALENALSGGGIVTFNCGSSPVTIRISREKNISSETLIDGNSLITLNGRGRTRIFRTESVDFSVSGLTIANGFTNDEGGGIYSGYRSKLTVVNCKFNNNVATGGGQFGGGGAIYIRSESTAVVERSKFKGNRANNGGAINNLLSNLTVTDSNFTQNTSLISRPGGGGGAIYIDGANGDNGRIAIRGSTFANNSAVLQGGAVFSQLYNSNTNTIENSTFSGNRVTGGGDQGYGGGIFNVGGTLSGLPGYSGGENNTILYVTGSNFSGNYVSNQGGGIWNGNYSRVNISSSTFSGNRADGLGGAIMRTSGWLQINGVTIENNSAGSQGGAIFGDANVTLSNSIIGPNTPNSCYEQLTDGGNNRQAPGYGINCTPGITIGR